MSCDRRTSIYCILAQHQEGGLVRAIGPYATADDALTDAAALRMHNPGWLYTPDVMEPPEKIANEEDR